ncbi:heme-binding protein [Paenibacillus sonchi]|uniref:Heme-binding protein n=1 Tax=Paenibacillus sonchi TaxID=373687 RepID=A0A974SC94_9BACL|nr:heme-binding protein [Paenibacillus sonchi]QQZ58975.1 heme-binding protein [Paenibacillus sonchi]
MNIEQLDYLEHLEYLEKELILTDFTNENALELGLIITNLAKAQKIPVAILIERNNVPIFTYLMENTSIECIPMLYRKKRSLINIIKARPTFHVSPR